MVIAAASPVQWVNFGSGCVGAARRLADSMLCGWEAESRHQTDLPSKFPPFFAGHIFNGALVALLGVGPHSAVSVHAMYDTNTSVML